MVRLPKHTLALLSLLSLTAIGACTPVPSKAGEGEDAAAETDPAEVCKHVRELADKDSDDTALLDQVERECVTTLEAMQARYQTFTTCVGLAGDQNAVYECEKSLTKQRSLLAAVSPTAKLEALCDHVLGMLEQELGEMASQMQPGEIDQLRAQCVADAGKQLEAVGPERFHAEADCILAAETLDAVQACGAPPGGGSGQPGQPPVQPQPVEPPPVEPPPEQPQAEQPQAEQPQPVEPPPAEPPPAQP